MKTFLVLTRLESFGLTEVEAETPEEAGVIALSRKPDAYISLNDQSGQAEVVDIIEEA